MKGKILGNRYELIERIGGGGMAIVYKAKCNLLNRYVAVKILRPEFTSDSDFLKRFKTESQAAASLSHPNVVSIYDVGSEDDIQYIVMEYVDGKTLKEYIIEKGVLPWKTAVNIAVQICSALEHAHKNHIIHRDIKPHNILITSELVAKVTDFGIARAVTSSTLNVAGSVIGSVHYFSPEQARGGYSDEKSDIYSLGIVLYEMLTGQVPFDGETPVTIALKHLEDEVKPPNQIVSGIPSSISDIVIKAVQKNQSQRYQSANEMLQDLYTALQEPDGDFVKLNVNNIDNEATQRINITDEMRKVKKPIENVRDYEQGEDIGMSKQKKGDKLTVIAALVTSFIILVLISAVGGYYFYSNFISSGTDIIVPNVVGMKSSEASALLKQQGISLQIEEKRYDDTIPVDVILSQSPEANIKMKENGTIQVIVSEGQETVIVPDLTGMNSREVEYELAKSSLKAKITSQFSSEIPVDYVIGQNPQKSAAVAKNSEVEVFISKGADPNKAKVPNLIGMTENVARTTILGSGFTVGTVSYGADNTRPNDTILSQSIAPDTEADKLSKIDIAVNKLDTNDTSSSQNPNGGSVKELSINLSDKGENDTFRVRVEMEGMTGKKVLYDKTNSRSDGEITIPISGTGIQIIRVYIDDKLDSEETIDFGEAQ